MANRSYLKSQKLKTTEADRQKIALLEAKNAALKKDKAALEQRVRMLKEVIQKNRGNLCSEVFFLVAQVLTSFLLYPQTALITIRRRFKNSEWRLRLWSSPWGWPKNLVVAWRIGCRGPSEVCRVLG
jgi:hypothetical protein